MPQGSNALFTYHEMIELVDVIRGETMELVEHPAEHYRNEFGFGMAHGHLKAANRFKTLLDEALAAQQQREEAFDGEEGWTTTSSTSPQDSTRPQ